MSYSRRRTWARGASADVAVYAPGAGPLYGHIPRASGGAETQSVHIARALAAEGLRVRHVVFGNDLVEARDGVEIVPIADGYAAGGLARRSAALAALRKADARVCVQRSAGFETLLVAAHARLTGARFVFSTSSVADLTRDRSVARSAGAGLEDRVTRWQYLIGLRLAHVVVVQTEDQRRLARTERGVEGRVIRSFADPGPMPTSVPREFFLWAGGLMGSKDPLAYVELARRVPQARFLMVAGDRGAAWSRLAEETRAAAAAVPNLELVAPLEPAELARLYPRAAAVVSTSRFEGFPNVFLEAWSCGTPALSFRVDPDGVVTRESLGVACSGSMERMVDAAAELWERRDAVETSHLRAYVRRLHAPEVVGPQWAQLARELAH